MIAIYAILIVMIIGAIIAIEARDLLSAVIAVGAVGLGLSLVALVAKAPDVAITQLVVEIISVVILIRATIRTGLPRSTHGSKPLIAVVALVFGITILSVGAMAFMEIPPLGAPHMRVSETYLTEGLADTGAVNLVSAILLDFRAYDTLGEATVLFAAAMGVLAVVRPVGRRKTETEPGYGSE
jgi:multisubunit Na+/H+ antiporter MnhB subunit